MKNEKTLEFNGEVMHAETTKQIDTEAAKIIFKKELKEQRKNKMKKILKIAGISIGVAAAAGLAGYVVGKITADLTLENDENYQGYLDERSTMANLARHACDGQFARCYEDCEGNKRWVVYTFTKKEPEWWADADVVEARF